MKKFLLLTSSILLTAALACQQAETLFGDPELKPGDKIGSMIVTTGTAKAPPLWAFCSPALENESVVTVECRVPSVSMLAIGYPFEAADQTLQALDWSELTWQLSLDGHPLDLDAFGLYHYALPELASKPSPVHEVFRLRKAWDVVIVNPISGLHTLHGLVRTGADTLTWVVNFTVEEPPGR